MELQHTNSDSPLKTPKIKSGSPLSKRIDTIIEDKELVDDVFIDANDNQLGEEKQSILCGAKRRKSIKEIQDCDTKHKLKDYINEKKRKIDQSRRILELKYDKYKK